jgi:predicted CXXCH cytochrome family protein
MCAGKTRSDAEKSALMNRAFMTACSIGVAAAALLTAMVMQSQTAHAQRQPSAARPSVVSLRLTAQPAAEGFVGVERCRPCHKAEVTQFQKTIHSRLAAADQRMDCESCHGPGKAHSDAEEAAHGEEKATAAANLLIFTFRGTPLENAARCLTCHSTSRGQDGFQHSRHAATAVACQACHATHLVEAIRASGPPPPPIAQAQFFAVPAINVDRRWQRESLLKDSQPPLCYSCHTAVRTQFAQPFHHRVPEGSIKCTDCHNPHGTQNLASLTAPGWETCTTCHVDKHGPFLFEHAPVRVEGCAICHTPHGATSRFLLARRESRFLCLQCHGDTHSDQVGVPHSRLGFQTRGDCTRCHVAIHGSNFNKVFLQ